MAADNEPGNRPTRRRLYGLLAVLAGVAAFVGTRDGNADDQGLALPVAHGQAGGLQQPDARSAPTGGVRSAQVRRAQLTGLLARALDADAKVATWPLPPEAARRSWEGSPIAPTPRVQAASSPLPVAPEAPFQWIGLWEQPAAASGVPTTPVAIIAATRGTRLVRAGDVLEDDWKVDRISSEQMLLTYLPTRVRQTLSMNKK